MAMVHVSQPAKARGEARWPVAKLSMRVAPAMWPWKNSRLDRTSKTAANLPASSICLNMAGCNVWTSGAD
jgi:hypothetical protein